MSKRIITRIDEIAVGAWSLQEWIAHIGGRMLIAQPMFSPWIWWDRIRSEGTMVVDERGSTSWWPQFRCRCWTVSTCRMRMRRQPKKDVDHNLDGHAGDQHGAQPQP